MCSNKFPSSHDGHKVFVEGVPCKQYLLFSPSALFIVIQNTKLKPSKNKGKCTVIDTVKLIREIRTLCPILFRYKVTIEPKFVTASVVNKLCLWNDF